MEELTKKDQEELKTSLQVDLDFDYSTRIIAVAVADDDCLNEHLRIPTVKGTPLCEEVHDLVRDCYYTLGVGWHDVGEIPVCLQATMPDVPGWRIDYPVPPEMLDRYLGEGQKADRDRWKEQYANGYRIKYLQMRSVY